MYNPKWISKLVRALMFQWQCFNDGSSREKNQIWKKGGACEVTIKVVNSYWATKAQKNCIAYQMRRKQRTCILVSRIKNPWLKHFFFSFLSDYVAVYFYSHSWQIRKTGKENSPNLWGFEATTFASSIPVHFLSLAMVAKAEHIETFLGKFVFCLISQCAKYDWVE